MKRTMLLIAFLLCIALPTYAITGNDYSVTITKELHDLTDHTIEVNINNLLDYNRDFSLGFYLQDLNFDFSKINDVYIYEWKPVSTEFPVYSNRLVDKECYNGNITEFYDCSYSETYESGTEIRDILSWKPTKMAMITQYDKVSTQYTDILIPKLTSKCKYDYNGNEYSCNGLKQFKITWKTPIVEENGYGSSGYFGMYDSLSGFDYDPFWNVSFNYCRNITVTNGVANYPAVINLTNNTNFQADWDDVRFVNTSCDNSGAVLSYLLRKKVDSNYATFDVLLDGTQNISVYYGNAGAVSKSNANDVWGNNLVAYYTFDETSGTDALDISGNGLDGTHNNSYICDERARYGCALGFDNTRIVVVGDDPLLDLTEMTLSAWINITTVDSYNSWLGKRGASSNYQAYIFTGSFLGFYSSTADVSNDVFTADTTNMAGITMSDSSGALLMYQNGTKVHTFAGKSVAGTNNDPMTIGAGYTVNQDDWWDGVIDEVRIFNDTLSEADMGKHYTTPDTTFTIGAEQSSPSSAPLWNYNITTFPANYDGTNSTMYIGWLNGSSTSSIDTTDVNITSNISGSNVTYEVDLFEGNSLSGNYSLTDLLGVGTYFWYSTASSNESATNTTDEWLFSIAQYDTTCTLGMSEANLSTVTYPTAITSSCACDNPEGSESFIWNSTDWSPNNDTGVIMWAGYNYWICNVTDTQNYTTDSKWGLVIVDLANLSTYINITFNTSNPVSQNSIVNATCNIPIGIETNVFKLYNDTDQIGNTTATFNATALGVINFTCNASATQNYTAGTTSNSLTVSSLGGIFINSVLDENTQTPLTFNLTVYNETQSVTVNDITSYNNNTITGDMTIAISKIGYVARDYYADIPSNDTYNLTGYLLQTIDGSYITYWAYSSTSTTGELDALINVTRFVGSGWVSVEQSLSDFEGKGTLFLSPYAVYRVNASKTGVGYVYISSYSANPSILLRLDMGGTGNATAISWLFTDVNYSLTPTNAYIRNSSDNLTLFNYTIAVGDADLEYYGMNITLADGTNIYSNNTTGATGGSITVNFNMTGREGQTINVRTWFKKADYDVWIWDRGYIVVKQYSYIPDLFGDFLVGGGLGLSALAGQIIALFVSIASAGIGKRITSAGSSILFLLALSVFTFIGFFDWAIFLLLGFVGLIIISGDKWR